MNQLSHSSIVDNYHEGTYSSDIFYYTQPERLYAIAKLKGLNPSPVESAKILEIGCSYGGNILPIAIRYPNSHVVGIDLSRKRIALGRKMVEFVGVNNMELLVNDIATASFNTQFDYIICHDVFSWVSGGVQNAIFEFITKNLNPNGIAFISYNTYPGWKNKEAFRDMLYFSSSHLAEHKTLRVAEAVQTLKFTQPISARNSLNPLNYIFQSNSKFIQEEVYHYFQREYFEESNTPCYFNQFMNMSSKYKLGYVSDSMDPFLSGLSFFDNTELRKIREYFLDNVEDIEQYVDFISNREFRYSLLTHQTHLVESQCTNKLADYIQCKDISNLHLKVISTIVRIKQDNNFYWKLGDAYISYFEATPEADIIFNALKDNLSTVQCGTLIQKVKKQLKKDCQLDNVWHILYRIAFHYESFISFTPIKLKSTLGNKPCVFELYRRLFLFIKDNPNITSSFSVYSQAVDISKKFPFLDYILPLLDGTRTITELTKLLRNVFENRKIVIKQVDIKNITNEDIATMLNMALQFLLKLGLLVPPVGYDME